MAGAVSVALNCFQLLADAFDAELYLETTLPASSSRYDRERACEVIAASCIE